MKGYVLVFPGIVTTRHSPFLLAVIFRTLVIVGITNVSIALGEDVAPPAQIPSPRISITKVLAQTEGHVIVDLAAMLKLNFIVVAIFRNQYVCLTIQRWVKMRARTAAIASLHGSGGRWCGLLQNCWGHVRDIVERRRVGRESGGAVLGFYGAGWELAPVGGGLELGFFGHYVLMIGF